MSDLIARIRAAQVRAAEDAVIASLPPELVSEEAAHRWRVRWETPDGMMTFVQIHRAGNRLTRSEVEAWAAAQVVEHPAKYARVAKCYTVADDEA